MSSKTRRLCLIPARGGSKRLPGKNILPFFGKPMLVWSIECARASKLFEKIHVSTEVEETGALAEAHGAVWDRRPEMLAGDAVSVTDVCLELLEREAAAGRRYEILTVLYAAVPLRKPADISETFELVDSGRSDFAMTVTDFPYDPCESLIVEDDGSARPWQPELLELRRQDRPSLKVDIGSVYAVNVSAFQSERSFYGTRLKVVAVPPERSVDIDTAADLAQAEYFYSQLQGSGTH